MAAGSLGSRKTGPLICLPSDHVLDNSGFFDDPPNHATSFWAAYAVHPFPFLPRGNIDLYYMGLDNKSVPFDWQRDRPGTAGNNRHTLMGNDRALGLQRRVHVPMGLVPFRRYSSLGRFD